MLCGKMRNLGLLSLLIVMGWQSPPVMADMFGIHGGLNSGFLGPLDSAGSFTKRRPGLLLGLNAEFRLTHPRITLLVETNYVQKGITIGQGVGAAEALAEVGLAQLSEIQYSLKFDYLEFPISAKIRFFEYPSQVHSFFNLGFAPAILVGSSLALSNSETEVDLSEIRTFDLSAHIALGIEFMLSKNSALEFQLRYTHGLLNITSNGLQHRSIQFLMAFNFGEHEPEYYPDGLFELTN